MNLSLKEENMTKKELGMKRKYEELYNNETENLKRRVVQLEKAIRK